MYKRILLLFTLFSIYTSGLFAQKDTLRLTLEEAIIRARHESPSAQSARHTFRSAYWGYRYYLANNLPSLTLSSNPYLNRSINKVELADGSMKFVEQNILGTDLTLSLSQKIAFTGGTLSLSTSADRLELLNDHTSSWQTSPINISYSQSLFGYNSLKWDKRIEPLSYKRAKRVYVETMELVASNATSRFFALVQAQSRYHTAQSNYADADTLYRFAQGRYNIGTISEKEMLQLELNRLNEETNRMTARIDVDNCMQELRSYLGIHQDIEIVAEAEPKVPDLHVELEQALELAYANSPDIQSFQIQKLQSESNVAYARANAGLKADIYLRFGLTKTADRFKDAYQDLSQQQYISLGLSLPILDWGRGKGRIRMARSSRDLTNLQIEQAKIDFNQNVINLVQQFNLQAQRVRIAARADETAQRSAEVTRRLYILGQSSVEDLNASISAKDNARSSYLSSINTFWSLYYTLRSITLYDFERNIMLEDGLNVRDIVK